MTRGDDASAEIGVRSLTTALGAFKARDKGYRTVGDVPAHVSEELAGAIARIVKLTPWASVDKRTLVDGADVLAEL